MPPRRRAGKGASSPQKPPEAGGDKTRHAFPPMKPSTLARNSASTKLAPGQDKSLTKPTLVQHAKRAHAEEDNFSAARPSKKQTVSSNSASISRPPADRRAATAKDSHPPIGTQAPIEALAILALGSGEAGELGLGPAIPEAERPTPNPLLEPGNPSTLQIVQLDCGGMHTVALTKDHRIVTWGVNDEGALGRDSTWDGKLRDVDGDPEEEGDLNPLESTPTPLPASSFPAGTRFVQVAAGDSCSLALTDTGLVYGWGTFKSPDGNRQFAYDESENIIESQDRPALVRNLRMITQIACGANHALALDRDGQVWSWGSGEKQQLGRRRFGRGYMEYSPHPIGIRNVKYIASGEYHSFAVDAKDNVWAWGMNRFGEAGCAKSAGTDDVLLPNPMKITDLRNKGVVRLAGGANHSAAVTKDGQCFVWGRVDVGQLGIRFSPEQLQNDKLIRRDLRGNPRICLRPAPIVSIGQVSFVACGTDHTLFVNDEGSVYVTGFNSQYQLGLGHDDDVEVARRIKGDVIHGMNITWAGAGGQFSMIAGSPRAVGGG